MMRKLKYIWKLLWAKSWFIVYSDKKKNLWAVNGDLSKQQAASIRKHLKDKMNEVDVAQEIENAVTETRKIINGIE